MSIQINGTSGISGVDGSATTPALQGTDTNTGISFGTDTVNVVTGGTTRATVDSSGRLLVGTSSSPSVGDGQYARIVVQGYTGGASAQGYVALARGEAASTITAGEEIGTIAFTDSSGYSFAYIGCSADAAAGSGDYPGRLVFSTTADAASSPTERMRITSNGCFKASKTGSYNNATNDEHEFNNQTTSAWNVRLRHTASSDPRGILLQYTGASPNDSTAEFIQAQDSSALRMTLRSNGGIANYQSNNANLCDEREKKNIVDLDSTWGCLKNWDLKKFHYNEDADTDDKRYGVIAQQVAPHCPEVITEWVKQKAEDAVLDDDGNVVTPAKEEIVRMGVKEQQMMWMAIKALQEAQTRIEQLETRVAQLEGGTN